MSELRPIVIADYGMGNLFSVVNACARAGFTARPSSEPADLLRAAGVILPGVGAMPDAMDALRATGLDNALRETVARGTPLLGICLGLQLLMDEGTEFRRHPGLGLVAGDVVKLEDAEDETGRPLRVPHIGWNAVDRAADAWAASELRELPSGTPMYFVHSYHVRPADAATAVATTRYGTRTFCSAVAVGPILGCQFHPERSGALGLDLLRRFATRAGAVTTSYQESAA